MLYGVPPTLGGAQNRKTGVQEGGGDESQRRRLVGDQGGLITEVHSADGSPPYVVRWLATGHVATVFPGPDAIVVTPEQQEAADERAQERAAHRGSNE
jgi:hypothetical protein